MREFITEEQVEAAIHSLSDKAESHARAKGRMRYWEKHIKSVLAIETLKQRGKSMTENKTRAEASEAYKAALSEYEESVYTFTLSDDKRAAAEATIEMFRTITASNRRGNI